ncbi:RNA-binding cell elongation regulator Jag/EloR [Clostridium sp. L2-50]|uniref:RNA-binding cell elongation regulator Jag/EloR n=1 Tax=Clostridium sp. L2-50 TaxID=411489 RepID=UPI00015BCB75|nr:RNA-binding cell elongation regulator Jag/EloR [Clostridium sp. L2-50]EDO58243.1 R3H domain protein [Clostridium sp. L2-50]UEA74246.1 protein jag [Lachnospiraceae bacterium GAM79]UEA77442.1 protein jag [Lachnospiraceae bacterium GAM79]
MEFVEFKGKTLDEALMQASVELGCASTDLEYNVVSEGCTGFLGLIGSKPFVISARKKKTFVDDVREYLETLFKAMDIQADIKIEFNETDNLLDIDVEGPEMGILIGKRGQTLDALQYLISLAVNKKSDSYIRVKLDTENYRARRKETLENLAKNIAFKVKRTKRSFALEPMNPYERRIIHATLQNDKYVSTRSEGEEPYRKVIVYLKKYDRNNK